MTSAEITEAMAFEQIEPDPAEVTVDLMSQLLALMWNVHKLSTDPPYVPSDFLPGGDRAGRLSRGMAVMAQFAANHAQRKN